MGYIWMLNVIMVYLHLQINILRNVITAQKVSFVNIC